MRTGTGRAIALIALLVMAAVPPARAADMQPDVREVLDIERDVQTFWVQKKFASIDALADRLRTSKERTINGFWKLTFIYLTFEKIQEPSQVWAFPDGYHWSRIHEWRKENPNSATAIIVESQMLAAQSKKFDLLSWIEHPGSSSHAVPVVDCLKAARELLEANAKVKEIDPHWFTIRLRIRQIEREEPSALIAAHEEALRMHPHYMRTHFETFEHLINAWYPDYRRIDALADSIVSATKPDDGMTMYARLIVHAMPVLHQKQPYSLVGFNWPKIRSGLQRILADYPTPWNANQFARLACLARDKETAKPLFERVGKEIRKEVWGSPIIYDQCKKWTEDL